MHPRRRDVTFVAFIASSLLLAPLASSAARATTVEPLSLAETIRRSDAVLRVRVGTSAAGWEPFLGEQAVVTTVFFEESSPIKGDSVRALRVLGGRVGDYEQTVVGMPRLEPGDEAFLFLVTGREVVCPFVGGWQGVFVIRDGQVHRAGRPVVDIVGGEPADGEDGERGMTSDAFEEQLRELVERASEREADPDHPDRHEAPPAPKPEGEPPPLSIDPIDIPAEVEPPATIPPIRSPVSPKLPRRPLWPAPRPEGGR